MAEDAANSPNDDYFNDLSQDATGHGRSSNSPQEDGQNGNGGNDYLPRPKRIACVLCRRRKLKCDGSKPSCGTCSRLGHDCAYDEIRKKSGPKRGYVKLLEQRLKEVEKVLKTQDPVNPTQTTQAPPSSNIERSNLENVPTINVAGTATDDLASAFGPSMMLDPSGGPGLLPTDFSWQMMELGVEEALPSPEVVDDLHNIYFAKVHPSMPMIHRPRYLAAMNLAPNIRPPVCLRYAMWTNVCSVTSKYASLAEHFYQRARKYAELDEMRGHGESMISVAHSQAWTLIAAYEFKMMYFPRAWLSVGRATRLAQMMGLHRQDGFGLDVKQCIPPPRDWTEREERRRTFWQCFVHDRCASVGTGWPMTIDERDILTNLPASEQAFDKSKPEKTVGLIDGMTSEGATTLSPFAGVVLMACLFGRNLTHLHRPDKNDNDHDLNGEFWKRHRGLDNILLSISLSLPNHLRLPGGLNDPNIIMLNMNIHTSTICLHQAAIFKADKNRMPAQINAESKRRCIIAADQITSIMKMISHVDLSTMNPFLPFCLYVAARVFVQYLKSRPEDVTVKSSMHFLLSAMQALKGMNPLTESFLVQLDVDLEGSGLEMPKRHKSDYDAHMKKAISEMHSNDTVHCSPIFEIRKSQQSEGESNPNLPTQSGQGRFTSPLSTRSRPSPPDSTSAAATFSSGMDIDQNADHFAGNAQHSQSASEEHTPNSSNHASSNTSYSPNNPSLEDPAFLNFDVPAPPNTDPNVSLGVGTSGAPFFSNTATYNDFNLSYQDMLSASQNPQAASENNSQDGRENPFSFGASWNSSVEGQGHNSQGNGLNGIPAISTGMTPKDVPDISAAPTGLTPMNMEDPEQWNGMLEGMGWNGYLDVSGS